MASSPASERPRAVTDSDIERIETLLHEPPASETAFTLDAIQGLIAATLSSPGPVDPAGWVDVALGDLAPGPVHEELSRLLRRIYEEVAADLFEGMGFFPIVPTDEGGVSLWDDWCAGYLEGTMHWGTDWQDLVADEDLAAPLEVIEAAAGEGDHSLDDAIARLAESLQTRFDDPSDAMLTAVQMVHDVNAERRRGTTVRREAAKVGRNNPCPCGSGRKFKQCCGKG